MLWGFEKQKEKTAEKIAVFYMKEYWDMNERVMHSRKKKKSGKEVAGSQSKFDRRVV